MDNLDHHREVDDDIMEAVNLVNALEMNQTHVEMTLGLWRSTSEEDTRRLKSKFKNISPRYEKLNSKDDIAVIPTIYLLKNIHDFVLVKTHKLIQKCFKADGYGEIQFINTEHNVGKLKILVCLCLENQHHNLLF